MVHNQGLTAYYGVAIWTTSKLALALSQQIHMFVSYSRLFLK